MPRRLPASCWFMSSLGAVILTGLNVHNVRQVVETPEDLRHQRAAAAASPAAAATAANKRSGRRKRKARPARRPNPPRRRAQAEDRGSGQAARRRSAGRRHRQRDHRRRGDYGTGTGAGGSGTRPRRRRDRRFLGLHSGAAHLARFPTASTAASGGQRPAQRQRSAITLKVNTDGRPSNCRIVAHQRQSASSMRSSAS